MGHLRQKLEVDPTLPRYLLTETGIGYRYQAEPDAGQIGSFGVESSPFFPTLARKFCAN